MLAALVAVAFVAGAIDAVAGGGGLLTVPALLWAGISPQLVFGTNKGSAVFGAVASLFRFSRSGLIRREITPLFFICGLVGSFAGAALLLAINPALLKPLVLVLLCGAAAFVAFGAPSQVDRPERTSHPIAKGRAVGLALLCGAYDGFFGPGTGTFLIVLMVALLGWSLPESSANAKVVNFASNLAAVTLFAWRGVVLWQVSLPMALGSFLGGLVGARFATQRGAPLIRRVMLVVVSALVLKLLIT